MIALLIATVLFLATLIWIVAGRAPTQQPQANQNGIRYPPVPPGIPFIGNTIQLGRKGLSFLEACHKEHGDAFSLNLCGQRMTFIQAPESVSFFFRAPDSELSFGPAVERFTHRVFGLPPADFLPRHHLLLDCLRSLVGTPSCLPNHAGRLVPLLFKEVKRFGKSSCCGASTPSWRKGMGKEKQNSESQTELVELFDSIKCVIFPAAVESLFGSRFVARHGIGNLQNAFFELDEGFELAASPIPHIFHPRFVHARRYLTTALRCVLSSTPFSLSYPVLKYLYKSDHSTALLFRMCTFDVVRAIMLPSAKVSATSPPTASHLNLGISSIRSWAH